jgi:hypothetical protein
MREEIYVVLDELNESDIWSGVTEADLPESLWRLAGSIGVEAIARIYRAGLGKRLYIPKKARADHPIALAIGLDKLEILSFEYGGLWIDFPKCAGLHKRARDRSIRERLEHLRRSGESKTRSIFAVAREFNLSAEAVKRAAA